MKTNLKPWVGPRLRTRSEHLSGKFFRPTWQPKPLDCDGTHCDAEVCPTCCDHQDMDDGHCLDCGEDRTEDLMADAYDRYKASRWED